MAPIRKGKGRNNIKTSDDINTNTSTIITRGRSSALNSPAVSRNIDSGSSRSQHGGRTEGHQEQQFAPPFSSFKPSKKSAEDLKLSSGSASSASIIRTRRQINQRLQQQQQNFTPSSFDPPSSSQEKRRELTESTKVLNKNSNNSSMSSRQQRGRGNNGNDNKDPSSSSHSSTSGPPPMTGQRTSDQWGGESSGYGDGRTPLQSSSSSQSQRYNSHSISGGSYGGHPPQQHQHQQPQNFSRYPRSSSMAASPNPMHYDGYDPNMHPSGNRDMHPPIGSIAAELDLAAKEGDEGLHLETGFSNAPSSSMSTPGSQLKVSSGSKNQQLVRRTPSTSGSSKRNMDEATPALTEMDELHRSGSSRDRNSRNSSSHHMGSRQQYHHHHNPPPYQSYHSGNSSYTPQEMKGTPGSRQGSYMHPPHSGNPYNSYPSSSTPSHGQQGGPGYFYSPSPYPQQTSHSHQQPPTGYPSYPGAPPSSQHDGGGHSSSQAPYSPYPHSQPQHAPHQSWSPQREQPHYSHSSSSGGRSSHHLNNPNQLTNPLSNSGGRLTPGRQQDGASRQILIDPKKRGGDSQSPPRNNNKRSRIGTWGGDGSDNSEKVTPEKIDERHMGSKGDQGQMHSSPFQSPMTRDKDPRERATPSSKKQGIGSSPLFTETPTGAYNFAIDTPGGHIDSTNFNFSPVGSLLKDDPFSMDIHTAQNPVGNPFDMDQTPAGSYNKSRQRRPPSPSNSRAHPGSKLTPRSPFTTFLDQPSPGGYPYPSPHRRQPRVKSDLGPAFPPDMYDQGNNKALMYPDRGDSHRGYKNSPPSSRNEEAYHQNRSREDWRRRNNLGGPHRVEIGNVGGIEQAKTRKSIDEINQIVRPPHLNQRPSPRPSPPNFPFGTPSNPPNRSASRGPGVMSSGGPHYSGPGGYPYPPSTPLYPQYGQIPRTTPIKPAVGKENDKSGDRRAPCNCKRSRCLKLYCECFAAEKFCAGCNCHDCNNIPSFETIRNEAIKATRAKNPNAFKPRFAKNSSFRSGPPSDSPSGHNMGCRCKKSACLKKYCECFEAGAVCADKCKCVDCQNFIGSQALIDRRRKIKDHRGAEFAMRSADQAWKSGRLDKKNDSSRAPRLQSSSSSHHNRTMGMSPLNSNSSHHHQHQHGTPASTGGRGGAQHSQPFAPPHHPGYASSSSSPYTYGKVIPVDRRHQGEKRGMHDMPFSRSPVISTPRNTSRSRMGFNPSSSKGRKGGSSNNEPNLQDFGPGNPKLSKSIALNIFSYLSNDDLHNASIVSKVWNNIAVDDELWQF